MRGKKILVVLLLILTLSLTGCTKYVKSDNGGIVRSDNGQNLVSNILCQPEDKDMRENYEKNKVKIDKLPKSSLFNFSI